MANLSDKENEILRKERLGLEIQGNEISVKDELNQKTMKRARTAMIGIAIIGLITAFIVQHLFSLDRLW